MKDVMDSEKTPVLILIGFDVFGKSLLSREIIN